MCKEEHILRAIRRLPIVYTAMEFINGESSYEHRSSASTYCPAGDAGTGISQLVQHKQTLCCKQRSGYVTDNTVPSISIIKQVQADFYALHALIQTHVLNTDNNKMSQIETGIADLRTEISLSEKYEAEMLSNEEDRQLTTDDQRIIEQYYQEIEKVLILSRDNKNTEARDFIANNVMPLFELFSKAIDKHVHLMSNWAKRSSCRVKRTTTIASRPCCLFLAVREY